MAELEADGCNVDEAQKAFSSFVVVVGVVAQMRRRILNRAGFAGGSNS